LEILGRSNRVRPLVRAHEAIFPLLLQVRHGEGKDKLSKSFGEAADAVENKAVDISFRGQWWLSLIEELDIRRPNDTPLAADSWYSGLCWRAC
jgi:hypothetical protein